MDDPVVCGERPSETCKSGTVSFIHHSRQGVLLLTDNDLPLNNIGSKYDMSGEEGVVGVEKPTLSLSSP